MREYRCYFLNDRNGIGDVVAFTSLNDDDAERQARDRFGRQNEYPGFEIWEKTRLVYRAAVARQAACG